MNILALDMGTQCGWAMSNRAGAVISGSQSFAPRAGEGPAQRWLKFRQFLSDAKNTAGEVHVVYHEMNTQFNQQHSAAHVYGGFLAMLQIWCAINSVRMVAVPPATVKKHWTGKGNAKKGDMIAECKARGLTPVDDNHADAIALLSYAREREGLCETSNETASSARSATAQAA